jgi:hypothetical protein
LDYFAQTKTPVFLIITNAKSARHAAHESVIQMVCMGHDRAASGVMLAQRECVIASGRGQRGARRTRFGACAHVAFMHTGSFQAAPRSRFPVADGACNISTIILAVAIVCSVSGLRQDGKGRLGAGGIAHPLRAESAVERARGRAMTARSRRVSRSARGHGADAARRV